MLFTVNGGDTLDPIALGQRLKSIRESRGIAATKLDEMAHVGRGTVRRIEIGERPEISLSVIVRIAAYLNVQLDWLVWGDEPDAAHGLNIPCASFLAHVNRLPGLLDYLESPPAIATPLHTVARALCNYRKHPPTLTPGGVPSNGWTSLMSTAARGVRLTPIS